MPKKPVISAIDLGTDKCVTLIATVDEETYQLQILGVSAFPTKGVKKSAVVDLEEALMSLTQSIDSAERMAGFNIKSAYVSLSGHHIASQNSRGVVAVASPTHEISQNDVERVIEAARAVSLPQDQSVIHVIPRDFKVDSQLGIKDPIGMTGIRLESEAHIISGMSTTINNIRKCVEDVGLNVDGFVFAGLAASEISLTETEKELGVVAVDIGAGSTSFVAYVEGAIEYSGTVPIGARHITQDIALGCRISLDSAEKIKIALSSGTLDNVQPHPGESKDDLAKRKRKEDKLVLESLHLTEDVGEISRKTVVEGIMYPRIKEIVSMVAEKLESVGIINQIPAGMVFSGGGADTIGLIEVTKRTIRLPARAANPPHLRGVTNDILKPAYAVSLGVLEYAKKHSPERSGGSSFNILDILSSIDFTKIKNGTTSFFKSLIP